MRYSTFLESMNFGITWNTRDDHLYVWRKGGKARERWRWTTVDDRPEVARILDRFRKYDNFRKELSKYAVPDPEPRPSKFKADVPRCPSCGARLDGSPDVCPSCDERVDYASAFDYVDK